MRSVTQELPLTPVVRTAVPSCKANVADRTRLERSHSKPLLVFNAQWSATNSQLSHKAPNGTACFFHSVDITTNSQYGGQFEKKSQLCHFLNAP
jgi:hypothetical protein